MPARRRVPKGDARVGELECGRVGVPHSRHVRARSTRNRATMYGALRRPAQACSAAERSQRGLRTSLGGRYGRLCVRSHRAEEIGLQRRGRGRQLVRGRTRFVDLTGRERISTLAGK